MRRIDHRAPDLPAIPGTGAEAVAPRTVLQRDGGGGRSIVGGSQLSPWRERRKPPIRRIDNQRGHRRRFAQPSLAPVRRRAGAVIDVGSSLGGFCHPRRVVGVLLLAGGDLFVGEQPALTKLRRAFERGADQARRRPAPLQIGIAQGVFGGVQGAPAARRLAVAAGAWAAMEPPPAQSSPPPYSSTLQIVCSCPSPSTRAAARRPSF